MHRIAITLAIVASVSCTTNKPMEGDTGIVDDIDETEEAPLVEVEYMESRSPGLSKETSSLWLGAYVTPEALALGEILSQQPLRVFLEEEKTSFGFDTTIYVWDRDESGQPTMVAALENPQRIASTGHYTWVWPEWLNLKVLDLSVGDRGMQQSADAWVYMERWDDFGSLATQGYVCQQEDDSFNFEVRVLSQQSVEPACIW